MQKKSMRVLIISDAWHPQVNGVVRTYEYLSKELEALGNIVEIIGPADFAINMPMPFYPEIKLVISPYRRLKRLIKDFKPDRIHIATEGPLGWATRKYCHQNNLSYTTSYHTQFPDYIAKRFAWLIPSLYDRIHHWGVCIVKRFHQHSGTIFLATKSLENQLLDWGFTAPAAHLTRGVDKDIFMLGEKSLFKDKKGPIALYVGRVAIEKNLEAFLGMPWDGTKVIVGDGPVRTSLEKKYPDALFVGKKTGHELAAHYQSSDVFVFPSKTDTFGIVLIEALACGLPIAAYDVTGPKDIITDKRLGILHEDLSQAAYNAIKSADREYCAQHVHMHYSWKKAGEQFYDNL